MMNQRSVQLGIACFLLGISAAAACSCLCAGPGALDVPQCACCEYKVVAVGQVVSIVGIIGGFGTLDVNVLVTEEIKDNYNELTVGSIATFTTQGQTAACGFPFSVGQTYIIFVYEGATGLSVSLCSPTQIFTPAALDDVKSKCSGPAGCDCDVGTGTSTSVTAVSAKFELETQAVSTLVGSSLDLNAAVDTSASSAFIDFPRPLKPCPKGTYRVECPNEITGQVPGFDYSNDPFVRIGYDCGGPWAILGDTNGDGLYDACLLCPEGTEAADLDGDGAEEVCTCPDPPVDFCGQCPGLDYSKFLDPANTGGIVYCVPDAYDCGPNAILYDKDCAVDENGDPNFEVCQLCPPGTQAFDSDGDGCEDKCVRCVPYVTIEPDVPVFVASTPIAEAVSLTPSSVSTAIVGDIKPVWPFIPPQKPCPPGWVPAPCEDAIYGLLPGVDYSDQLAGLCDTVSCGINFIMADMDGDGVIDSCLICPFPLVARDLDGDGCKEICDCGKPFIGPIELTPFVDSFVTPGPVKISPIWEPAFCNNCPNIPFYNSPFCVVGGFDCGPNGILGDTDCDGEFDVCYECPDGTFPIDTNGDECEDCCSECIPVEPIKGACCNKTTGVCIETFEKKCKFINGVFTPGVPCSFIDCKAPVGACCVSDGCIEATTAANCKAQNGKFFLGKTCDEVDYICNPTTGACCVANVPSYYPQLCFEGPPSDCPGEYFSCKTCDEITDLCKRKGACCFDKGGCGVVYEVQCEGVGTFFPGVDPCPADLCPLPTGACCTDTECTEVTEPECDGKFFYGKTCVEVDEICFPEPDTIACCLDGTCIFEGPDSPNLRKECTLAGGTVIIGDCSSVDCPTPKIVSCCLDNECVYEGPFHPSIQIKCESVGGVYAPVKCDLNNGCEDPPDLFSCCKDGICIIESPFLYIVQEQCEEVNGIVFNGPCSQNEECSKGSCCLPNGDCYEGILTNDFIIECKAAGGEAANGPCTDTCGEKFACCLPDGTCADGPLTPDNVEKCKEKGGNVIPGVSCATVLCPVLNVVTCCVDGKCKLVGFPGTGIEEKCKELGGVIVPGPCTGDICPKPSPPPPPPPKSPPPPPKSPPPPPPKSPPPPPPKSPPPPPPSPPPPPPPKSPPPPPPTKPPPPPPTPDEGACCLETGGCIVTSATNCKGKFFPGKTCSDVADECPTVAACCFQGSCFDATGPAVGPLKEECDALNGVFVENQPCTPDLCEKFACCLEDGTCFDGPSAIAPECIFYGGVLTAGASCSTVKCGSCCLKGTCLTAPLNKCLQSGGCYTPFATDCSACNC